MSDNRPMLRQQLKRVELAPDQKALWETTVTAFLWHCPSFSHVFYSLLDRVGSDVHAVFTDDPEIPVAATDGEGVAFNVNTYFGFNLHARVFIFCHEIMHCILNHPILMWRMHLNGSVSYPDGLVLEYNPMVFNMAADYVINDTLVDAKHGKLPAGGLWDRNIGTWEEAAIDVYRKFKGGGGGGGGGGKPGKVGTGNGNGKGGFDVILQPGTLNGKDPTTASLDRNDAEWRTTCETANQIARLRGDMPSSLKRLFGEALEPQVPWNEHVETLICRRLGSDGYNWVRPDRRLIIRDIYAPGRSGKAAKLVVVAGDTSGSVGDKETDMFFAELAGVFDTLRPAELVIMWCDADVHDVDYCDEPGDLNEIRRRGVGGGGGTDFRPVFDKIDELGMTPDALIYLTDGYGGFPEVAPSYPVIWGSIALGPEGFPFGDVVMVPRQLQDD